MKSPVVALCAALLLAASSGCGPERLIITDPDDLAKFAEASRAAAEKRAEANKSATAATTSSQQPAAAKSAKPKLDATAQAFLDKISKEQSLDAETIAAYEELLGALSPEMRTTWIAQQESLANKASAAARPTAPRELPPVVRAEPIAPRHSEVQPADYREPLAAPMHSAGERNELSFADRQLLAEVRSLQDKVARLGDEQKEAQAAQLVREEAKEQDDQTQKMLDVLRGQGAMRGGGADDDVSGALSGLSTNFVHAEVAAAMAKANSKKSDKKAPLPGEGLSSIKSEKPPISPTSSLPASARLEQLWSQVSPDSALAGNDQSLSEAMRKKIFFLVAGDPNAASTPPEDLTPVEKEYWKHLMRVLELSMKLGDHPRRDRQAALVNRALRDAAAELESASVLDLQNAAFCSSVQSFGNYVEFEETTFKPDEEVILYVEPQNFASKPREDGKAYETKLHAAYQILDSSGKRVADLDLPAENGICRQRRRDYFLAYPMHLPKAIAEGDYTLQLTMEDKISGKFGQTTLKFSIRK
jgi:hypothetical protein